MPRYLLTLSYDGSAYAGWQRQLGHDSIQERVEAAVSEIVGTRVAVHGSGRTDAGVHALRQTAHVDLPRAFEPPVLVRALNAHLPDDVAVRSALEVGEDLHARFSAVGKRYVYRCRTGPDRPVIGRGYCWWIPVRLDLARMRAGAAHLVGEHDFAAFATNPGHPRSRPTVRRVDRVHLIGHRRGFDLFIQGNGFLYNMVRTIAGTLMWVGKGKLEPTDVAEILASADRRCAGPNAPPCGLFLQRVLYDPPLHALTGT